MRVKFVEFDENGLYVYDLRISAPGDPADPEYRPISEDGKCFAIRADGKRCHYEEQENGLCHVHNPNAVYFHQHYSESGRRQKTVAPLIGDESYRNHPSQESLF